MFGLEMLWGFSTISTDSTKLLWKRWNLWKTDCKELLQNNPLETITLINNNR